jgi:hypothetical protein
MEMYWEKRGRYIGKDKDALESEKVKYFRTKLNPIIRSSIFGWREYSQTAWKVRQG